MAELTQNNELIYGMVISGVGGLYEVETDNDVIKCRARGAFRSEGLTVTVGDRVGVRVEPDGSAAIMEICDRKSVLIRPPLANLDLIFITVAAAKPAPALDVVDKLSCIAHHNGIKCAIIVTKRELDPENAENIAQIYSKTPFKVFVTSAAEDYGIEQLRDFITTEFTAESPKICAFAGASGVGKSTLLSKIFPKYAPDTGNLSKIGRGKHTTRAVTLYPIPLDGTDGRSKIADTPGFSLLDFTRFDFFELTELAAAFPEFDEYIGTCKYTKCTHLKEEGCCIVDAVKRHIIAKERHNSYVSLFAELKEKEKHKYD